MNDLAADQGTTLQQGHLTPAGWTEMQSRQGRFPRTLTGLHRCVGGLGPALLWGSNLDVDHLHNQLLIPIHAIPETLLVQVLEMQT